MKRIDRWRLLEQNHMLMLDDETWFELLLEMNNDVEKHERSPPPQLTLIKK